MLTHIDNRYRILKFLGEGGMGKVYLVADEVKDNKEIALKTIQASGVTPDTIRHFKNEFQLLTRLQHPNLCEVYDFGFWDRSRKKANLTQREPDTTGERVDGIYYFTSEYIDGVDFMTACEELTEDELYPLLVQIAHVMSYIHSRQFIHYDIKPTNIMVTGAGKVKLMDLGLAKPLDISSGMHIRGTVGYIAPEIIKGEHVDFRADLYSLGVTLYQVISHKLPFEGESTVEILRKHLIKVPVPLIDLVPAIRPQLSEIVNRLMAKHPSERFPSANSVIRALNTISETSFTFDSKELTSCYVLSGRFVGREPEFNQLKQALIDITTGSTARFFLVSGVAGVGKSRLMMEYRYHTQLSNVNFLEGVCFEDRLKAYQPFQRIIRTLVTLALPEEIRKFAPEIVKLVPELIESNKFRPSDLLPPSEERERLHREITHFMLAVAARLPLVIVFRDIHWADDASLELLKYLNMCVNTRLAKGLELHLILCATFRDEVEEPCELSTFLRDVKENNPHLQQMPLETLSDANVEELIQSMFGFDEIPEDFIRRIITESNGNPFFVEAVIEAMISHQVITYAHDHWKINEATMATTPLPDTLSTALKTRLTSLAAEELGLLSLMAVLDRPVTLRVMETLYHNSCAVNTGKAFAEILQTIQNRKLVKWADGYYRITHNQTVHLIYDNMDPDQRLDYHRIVFESLESLHADNDFFVDELAHHAYQSRNWSQALHYLLKAGHKNSAIVSTRPAIDCFEKALEILKKQEHAEISQYRGIYSQLAKLYEIVGQYQKQHDVLAKWLRVESDPRERARIHDHYAESFKISGNLDQALEHAEIGLQTLGEDTENSVAALLFLRIGGIYKTRAEFDKALEYYEKSLLIHNQLEDPYTEALTYKSLGGIYHSKHDLNLALTFYEKSIELFEHCNAIREVVKCYNNIGTIYLYLPETGLEKPMEYFEKGLKLSREMGDARMEASFLNNMGICCRQKGDQDKALAYFQRSLETQNKIGESSLSAVLCNNMGTIYSNRFDNVAALKFYTEALRLYRKTGSISREGACLRNIGEIYSQQAEYEKALQYFSESLQINRKLENRLDVGNVLLSFSSVYMELKEYDQARACLAESLEISRLDENPMSTVLCLINLSRLARAEFHFEDAFNYCEQAEELVSQSPEKERVDDLETLLSLNVEMALLYEDQGCYNDALRKYEDALKIIEKSEGGLDEGATFLNCAYFFLTLNQLLRSQTYFQKAMDYYNQYEKTSFQPLCYHGFAKIAQIQNDLDLALKHYQVALEMDRTFIHPETWLMINTDLAYLYYELSDYDQAEKTIDCSLARVDERTAVHLKAQVNLIKGLAISHRDEEVDYAENSWPFLKVTIDLLPSIQNQEVLWKILTDLAIYSLEKRAFNEALNYLIQAEKTVKRLSGSLHNSAQQSTYLAQRFRNFIYIKLERLAHFARPETDSLLETDIEENPDWINRLLMIIRDLQSFLESQGISDEEKMKVIDLKLREIDRTLQQHIEQPAAQDLSGYYNELLEIIKIINSSLLREDVLVKIVDLAIHFVRANRGFLFLFDTQGNLDVRVARNQHGQNLQKKDYKISQTIIDRVVMEKEPLLVADITDDDNLFTQRSVADIGLRSVMCIPLGKQLIQNIEVERRQRHLPHANELFGILYVDSQHLTEETRFSDDNLKLLKALADQASVALINATLYEKTNSDGLTGLYLRPYFEDNLKDEIAVANEGNYSVTVLMLDIIGFKEINNRHGRRAGDQVLREIGLLLKKNLRVSDTCARYGGDIFAITLPNTPQKEADFVSDKIRHAIQSHDFSIPGVEVCMGCSIYPDSGDEPDQLLVKAEQALYRSKHNETGGLVFWTPELAQSQKMRTLVPDILTGDPIHDYQNVEMLLEAIEVANSTLDLDKLLDRIVDIILKITSAERCLLLLLDEEQSLSIRVARSVKETLAENITYSRSIPENVIKNGNPICIKETNENDTTKSMIDLELRTVMCVPLEVKGKRLGVIYVDSQLTVREFSTSEMAFLNALARQIAAVIDNARLHRQQIEIEEEKVRQLEAEKVSLQNLLQGKRKIIGNCPSMQKIFESIRKVSYSDATVLVYGESGTGKESVAHTIHSLSSRKDGPYVVIDCGAIPENLIESELFGHEKGAFTGAYAQQIGKFEQANNGTVFLDEIGELPVYLQVKLLRVLQESEIQRVGGKKHIQVNIRIIAATNRRLKELIEKGEFRQDLYYRLNIIELELPPLRERGGDIILLANFFLNKFNQENGKKINGFSKSAIDALQNYKWPGNIRELEHKVERAVIMSDKTLVSTDDLDLPREKEIKKTLKEAKEELEIEFIRNALARHSGNVTNAAVEIGISRVRLHQLMEKYGFARGNFEK